MIYHITTKENWEKAISKGCYETESLSSEGFIHNCSANQVQAVLKRYYASQTNLVLLHVDESKLTALLKYELSPSTNEEFPHIYGTINISAVVLVENL